MSSMIGGIINSVQESYPYFESNVIASAVAVISGCIILGLGLFHLGFIVNLIPLPVLEAFMTGSALSIIMKQIPVLLGNDKHVEMHKPTYLVFISFWKNIKYCDLNAALGLTALFLLYFIRFICTHGAHRYPIGKKIFFYINSVRSAFVILLYLLISWLINRKYQACPRTSILGNIPRGLQDIGIPSINQELFSAIISHIPAVVIILVIQHIAIAKSLGSINNYTINPNQELVANGITNIFGPFFGAYPATGSFSRTAINSQVGVRTPLAGIMTSAVLVLAIYVLTSVFYWISHASLAAVIIHAISHLFIKVETLKQFWYVNPIEFSIFWIGVIIMVFTSIELGIYITIILSVILLFYRIIKANGHFLSQVPVQQFIKASDSDHLIPSKIGHIYIPSDHHDGSNPAILPNSTENGIFIYRLKEGILYPNAARFMEVMVEKIFHETRPGKTNRYECLGQQPWNLQTSRHPEEHFIVNDIRPRLHAIILDCTGVPHLDVTGLQHLTDVRRQLDNYADWKVHWHFVGLSNPWMKRALNSAAFGMSPEDPKVFTLALIPSKSKQSVYNHQESHNSAKINDMLVPINDINRSFFHVDLDEAYEATIANLSQRRLLINSNSDKL
jgi:sodium-independent sulfate anion transporter 11